MGQISPCLLASPGAIQAVHQSCSQAGPSGKFRAGQSCGASPGSVPGSMLWTGRPSRSSPSNIIRTNGAS